MIWNSLLITHLSHVDQEFIGVKWYKFLPVVGWMEKAALALWISLINLAKKKMSRSTSWVVHALLHAGVKHKWSRALAPSPGRKLCHIKVSLLSLTSNQLIAVCLTPPPVHLGPLMGTPNAA